MSPIQTLSISSQPTPLQKFGLWCFKKLIQHWKKGGIELLLPNGAKYLLGPEENRVCLQIRDYRFFNEILWEGDIGFGQAYMWGYWETSELTKLLQLFVENQPYVDDHGAGFSWFGEILQRWGHRLRANTLEGSRKNIQAHYDLGNDFYRLFLDETLSYSCGIYVTPNDSLETAQNQKIQTLLKKAQLKSEEHLLEIGSGWGSLAITAARQYGCRVTSITLSQEQHKLATERVRLAGLSDLVSIELRDYRHIQGNYDKIISVEMLEAVGHENFPLFFQTCDRLLKPQGWMVLQVISIVDQKYEKYRKSCDWIQRYIFPGSLLPSLTALTQAMTQNSRFVVEHLENIGIHYARTLREWNQRFQQNWKQIAHVSGFKEIFRRQWEYYFCYCEAGFLSRYLGDLQLILTRPTSVPEGKII